MDEGQHLVESKMNARALIESDDMKAELLADSSVASVLNRHGMDVVDSGTYQTRGWGDDNMADVTWKKFTGLTIPTTVEASPVVVTVTLWFTPKWFKYVARIELFYGSFARRRDVESQEEGDEAIRTRLDLKLDKLKKRLKLYRPKTDKGLDRIINALGYTKS